MYEEKLRLIRWANPDIRIDKTEFIDSGYHSLAVVVNGEWVFRFPLRPEFYDEYVHEERVLERVHPSVRTRVPALTVYKEDGIVFTKHRMIQGVQYARTFPRLDAGQKERLARDLAFFMAEMHGVSADGFPVSQFSPGEYRIHESMNLIADFLPGKAAGKFRKTVEEFEERAKGLKPDDAVLCHTDLNENNFLILDGVLNGVIDFGNACLRDYSSEFAALLKFDFNLTKRTSELYEEIRQKPVDLRYAVLLQKIRCYGGMIEEIETAGGKETGSKRLSRYFAWLEHIEAHEGKGM